MYDVATNNAAAAVGVCERNDWWSRCDRVITFLLALYLFFVSQILLTTSMKTMLRFLPQIDSFCTGVLGDRNNTTADKFLPCEFNASAISPPLSKESTTATTTPPFDASSRKLRTRNNDTVVSRDESNARRAVDASSIVAASAVTLASYR